MSEKFTIRKSSRRVAFGLFVLAILPIGCTEFTHFGQVSDRQGTWPVNDVRISQQQGDGQWRPIGTTDGKGKWNIQKAAIGAGGRVKFEKPGYQTVVLSESEFLQQS
ncbi:MAG TPA: hypothetical protein VNT79_17380, partial [Phycisphaerae bacterium]|nr:hypothetical protein [Phycisphaerae bacterium]